MSIIQILFYNVIIQFYNDYKIYVLFDYNICYINDLYVILIIIYVILIIYMLY